jgi:tetratricopeptide (TPR) repeat protein
MDRCFAKMKMSDRRTIAFVCALAIALAVIPSAAGQNNGQASTPSQALALEQKGQNAEAKQAWLSVLDANPRNAEALAHLGLLEARQQHYDKAIDYYRRAAAISSEIPGLQMNLGLAFFKASQFPDAIGVFTAELKRHPGDPRLTILLGMAHYGMKDYLVAIPYLQRAAAQDSQNIALRVTLAQSCLWSKQDQCALDACQEILALVPNSADADMLAGEALDRMGDKAGAVKALKAAVQADPTHPDARFGLGYLLWAEDKWPEAADEFQLELRTKPDHPAARTYLADAWVHQNEFEKALPVLERLAAEKGSDSMVHLDLGIVYAQTGRKEDALRELRTAEQSDSEDRLSPMQIARLYQLLGKQQEVAAELEARAKKPAHPHASLEETLDSIESPTP